jgi:hypothetical protein
MMKGRLLALTNEFRNLAAQLPKKKKVSTYIKMKQVWSGFVVSRS